LPIAPVLLLALLMSSFSCTFGGLLPQPVVADPVAPVGTTGQVARRHLAALTEIGARWSGSAEEAEAGQYIAHVLADLGYAPSVRPFSGTDDDGEDIDSANIVAVKVGDSAETIVVGAHYDSSDEGRGSDDNGSGVAVLLEAAELIAAVSTPCTVYFVAFGAEEAGCLGSDAFVSTLSSHEASTIALFVNLDSISAGDRAYVYSQEGAGSAAREEAIDWATSHGYDLRTVRNVDLTDEDGYATADYGAFEHAGIPWLYFEATNWELGDRDGYTQVDPRYGDEGAIIHTEYDDLEYLDQVFPGRVDARLDLFVTVLCALLTGYR
jgi:hypothetical protein